MRDKGGKPTDFQEESLGLSAFLLVPFLAGRPCFCLVVPLGLTVGLAMGGVESIGGGSCCRLGEVLLIELAE